MSLFTAILVVCISLLLPTHNAHATKNQSTSSSVSEGFSISKGSALGNFGMGYSESQSQSIGVSGMNQSISYSVSQPGISHSITNHTSFSNGLCAAETTGSTYTAVTNGFSYGTSTNTTMNGKGAITECSNSHYSASSTVGTRYSTSYSTGISQSGTGKREGISYSKGVSISETHKPFGFSFSHSISK